MYLGLSLDTWNIALQIFVGLTAFAATALFVAQRAVIVLQDDAEKKAEYDLKKYKSDAAERLDKAIKEADRKIAEANTRGEEAKSESSKANERAGNALARAAELERVNIELREKMASRRISAEQHNILVDILSKSPAPFDIALMGDPESVLFANDLLKTFADAHWAVGQKELPLSEIWTGLVLFQTDDPAGSIMLQALTAAKIPFSIGDDAHKRSKATIMVGNKPSQF
jgi:hypothetical protein